MRVIKGFPPAEVRVRFSVKTVFCPCAQRRGFSFPKPFGKEENDMSKNFEAKKVVVSEIEEKIEKAESIVIV